MNPVNTFRPYFPKIHSNIIFSSTPRSSEWSIPSRFSDKSYVCISHLRCARACVCVPTYIIFHHTKFHSSLSITVINWAYFVHLPC